MNKGELKSELRILLLQYNPELTVTDVVWDKLYHFYQGYVACFDAVVKFPVEDSFAQNFILEETFKYLLECFQ